MGQGHILSSLHSHRWFDFWANNANGSILVVVPLHAIADTSFTIFPISVSPVSYMLMVTALVALGIVALFSSRNLVRERAMKAMQGGLCAHLAIVLPG